MAARVELRTGVLVRGVQRDELMADEIVAACNAFGDGVFDGATGFHEGCSAPGV